MLTIRNLTKTYDNGVHALKGINLDIPNGMFGLLGPNGAGKSSLIRTIAKLRNQVWRKTLKKEELTDAQARFAILSTRLVGAAPMIHVLASNSPDGGFEQVEPDLEDVYFSYLQARPVQAA